MNTHPNLDLFTPGVTFGGIQHVGRPHKRAGHRKNSGEKRMDAPLEMTPEPSESSIQDETNTRKTNAKALSGRLVGPNKRHVVLDNNTVWPGLNQGDYGWLLTHGSSDYAVQERLMSASVFQAYCDLINMSNEERNKVCKALREANVQTKS